MGSCFSSLPRYTLEEVKTHNDDTSCWIVAHGYVYDATEFLNKHPVGSKPILDKAGKDATVDFNFHRSKSQKEWNKYRIGIVI